MASNEPSQAFWNLHNRLHTIVRRQQHETGNLHVLPLTAFQLAREAERLAEFKGLVLDMFDPQDQLSNLGDLELSEINDPNATDDEKDDASDRYEDALAERDARLDDFTLALAELLKRSGYYHALLSDEDNFAKYYTIVAERIPARHRIITKLYLLDGCTFARDRFYITDILVTRMSPSELEEFGPSAAVCNEFFPNESIDLERFSKQWFLNLEEDEWTAYDYDRVWDDGNWDDKGLHPDVIDLHLDDVQREIAAGVVASRATNPALPKYFDAVLVLSLYRPEFFEITRILICEQGWRRVSVWSTIPRGERGSYREKRKSYSVSEEQWPAFENYVNMTSSGLNNAKASNGARSVTTAVRRYLQATFATGDVFPEWDTNSSGIERPSWRRKRRGRLKESRGDVWEDALLRYVFALEALLTGETKEAISEKVAISAALLIGREDGETKAVRDFVKRAYSARSELVHGIESKRDVDIVKLRRICQRVLIIVWVSMPMIILLDLTALLRELPVSNSRQLQIKRVRDRILPLLTDQSSLSEA
jgi:hypothetical protein